MQKVLEISIILQVAVKKAPSYIVEWVPRTTTPGGLDNSIRGGCGPRHSPYGILGISNSLFEQCILHTAFLLL
jgi:hypothetical protein